MASYTWVDLDMPEAALLADLNGIVGDLRKAREYAQMMQHKSESGDLSLVEPLCIAMTVVYARIFSRGVRHHLKESDLKVLSESQRSQHQFLRDFRDKHVAHSVNEFEENQARAYYCEERLQQEGFTSIGYGGGRIASIGGDFVQGLIEITHALEAHLREQIAVEEQRLLSIVRALPVEAVLARGQKTFRPVLGNVSRRRVASSNRSTK